MHPSMAFLPSADEAALAYAQVGTMVEYLSSTVGKDALSRVLDRVRTGTDALEAVAGVAGQAPDAFMDAWRTDLRKRRLVARGIAAAPTVLGPADDAYGVDPLLAKRKDLAGFARLGDLLLAAGKPEAALAEYAKALGGAEGGSAPPSATPPPGVSNADEPPSPLVVARRAEALRQLGRVDEAIASLQASVLAYPEFPATRKALAALLLARGKSAPALAEYRAAADVNPFDPVVQTALADLYARSGASALAERHARYRRILDLGGAPPSEPPTRAAAPAAPTGASE
jgi:Flp pilus assembly protein TadD